MYNRDEPNCNVSGDCSSSNRHIQRLSREMVIANTCLSMAIADISIISIGRKEYEPLTTTRIVVSIDDFCKLYECKNAVAIVRMGRLSYVIELGSGVAVCTDSTPLVSGSWHKDGRITEVKHIKHIKDRMEWKS